jgi:hypothetical protein
MPAEPEWAKAGVTGAAGCGVLQSFRIGDSAVHQAPPAATIERGAGVSAPVKPAFDRKGIEILFPHRSLYLESQ